MPTQDTPPRDSGQSGAPAEPTSSAGGRSFDAEFGRAAKQVAARAGAGTAMVTRLMTGFDEQSRKGLREATEQARAEVLRLLLEAHGRPEEAPPELQELAGGEWSDPCWQSFTPHSGPATAPSLVRVGTIGPRVGWLPTEPQRPSAAGSVAPEAVPALVPFLGRNHLLIRATGAGLDVANEALQALLFRLAALIPPGKLRMSLIDPIGRGKAFTSLLALHSKIKGDKVWDDPPAIAAELERLKAEISNVVQHYLQHKYSDIEQFNQDAGDIAEPYRVVGIAGFPSDMAPAMANDILKIANTGVRAGVHLALSVDTAMEPPRNFPMAELERRATVLEEQDGAFRWRGVDLSHLQHLTLDTAPPTEVIDCVTRALGPSAAASDEVQISLDECLDPVEWREPWTGSGLEGIAVPVGVTGARKALTFELAGGTTVSPHALIGGKSGFGKSNLLHAIVLALCHRYSPDELELYLVDMKEGVEFEPYRSLPHARVVAIESDREFALSVLEGVRDELERRGELFRGYGNDYNTYREKTKEPLPRIVLMVDEFQILFERLDHLKREANVLLTDLSRRGRSFGIHVLLASQTLTSVDFDAGALSQIGVRVALQLDDHDSEIVLGRGNPAARNLIRKGEAIYNNRNGLLQHNVKFQVAWLDEDARSRRLASLERLAAKHGFDVRPRIFEGSRPASVLSNVRLTGAGASRDRDPDELRLFVGEPLTLAAEHASFGLVRQRRSHLIIAGQHEPSAAAVFLSALASALRGPKAGAPRLLLLNLARVNTAPWKLVRLCRGLSRQVEMGGRSKVVDFVTKTYEDFKAREEESDGPPLLLGIFGLHHAEGDFPRSSFGVPKDGASPAKMLSELARKGPDVGVHLVLWSATYESLATVLERDVREFDGRIAVQGGDALQVIPDARLREHVELRAPYGVLFDQETRTRPTKFRCYGDLAEWLERGAQRRGRKAG